MGTAGIFTPEKLVMGILTSRIERKGEVLSDLSDSFGPIDYESPAVPFDFTDYYGGEMGGGIVRLFVSFRRLVDPGSLALIKRTTNDIEHRYREGRARKVNLDPGLLCLSRFVLATTKNGSHRIPLSSGIYGEVTLLYERGSFRPVEWTYPDYRSAPYIAALNGIRGLYKAQVRRLGPPRES
jgi:hypothetical protein